MLYSTWHCALKCYGYVVLVTGAKKESKYEKMHRPNFCLSFSLVCLIFTNDILLTRSPLSYFSRERLAEFWEWLVQWNGEESLSVVAFRHSGVVITEYGTSFWTCPIPTQKVLRVPHFLVHQAAHSPISHTLTDDWNDCVIGNRATQQEYIQQWFSSSSWNIYTSVNRC